MTFVIFCFALGQNPYMLLLDSVYDLQDSDGRAIWEMFEELPSREVNLPIPTFFSFNILILC